MNIAAQLAQLSTCNRWDDRPAFHVTGRTWKHGEVHDLAARAATVLSEAGVAPGDRVLIALADGIGWVASFLAIARLGGVAVPVNPLLTTDDHAFMAGDSEAKLVISTAGLTDRFTGVRWLDEQELLGWAACAEPAPAHPAGSEDALYAQYTSGTTGRPKAAVHAHGHLLAYHRAVGEAALRITPSDVALSISKLYFAYGLGNALVFPLFSGSSAVLVAGRPTAAVVEDLVDRRGVTLLYGVPSAYANLVAEAKPAAFRRSIRAAVSAGETLRPPLAEQTAQLLGAPVLEQIGSTEAGHAFCANTVSANVPGTVGRPTLGYRVELRDPDGNVVTGAEPGEMWVRGPSLLLGYLNLPDQTSEVLVNGWLCTHDLATRNPDGSYTHIGRTDDMEMVGGITISPHEIETVLGGQAGIAEVAVATRVNGRGATELHAFVVADATVRNHAALRAELQRFARVQLAPFKVPRRVHVVEALPRTATGKLRRFKLREGAL